ERELLKGDVAALAKVLRQLEGRKAELAKQLTTARQKAATPATEAWRDAKSLLGAVEKAPDPRDARLRLRSGLRAVIAELWLRVVPGGHDRLCAVQVWFADSDRCRSYLILHRPPRSNGKKRQEGGWWARSFADTALPARLDLRKRDHTK